jgi:hypothetical protein
MQDNLSGLRARCPRSNGRRPGSAGVPPAFLRAAALTTALFALTVTAAGAVDLVVVEARGLTLRPGQMVDGSKPLTLQEGQQIVLISPAGKTIKLKGPSDQPPISEGEAGTADVAAALKTLVTAQNARSDRLGVVRGAANQVVPPEPWLIDVTHGGNRCLREGSALVLWRVQAGGEVPFVIAPSDRSWRAHADWPAGADRLVMPQELPVRQRSSYAMSLGGKETAITLITMPSTLTNDPMRVAWMIEAGCDAQAQSLLQTALNATGARGR